MIWKSLKVDYFEFTQYTHNVVSTPQGSIISPILANIFINQLDYYVALLKQEFDQGKRSLVPKIKRQYKYAIAKNKKKGDMKEVKNILRVIRKLPGVDFHTLLYKRLVYVKYTNNWVIGIRGSYKNIQFILDKVSAFLSDLGLSIYPEKTKITSIVHDKVSFLGTYIQRSHHTKFETRNSI